MHLRYNEYILYIAVLGQSCEEKEHSDEDATSSAVAKRGAFGLFEAAVGAVLDSQIFCKKLGHQAGKKGKRRFNSESRGKELEVYRWACITR